MLRDLGARAPGEPQEHMMTETQAPTSPKARPVPIHSPPPEDVFGRMKLGAAITDERWLAIEAPSTARGLRRVHVAAHEVSGVIDG
jgi:hypothetical protein